MGAMTQVPPGWYADPDSDPGLTPPRQRYWDGSQWTAHIQPPAYAPMVPTTPDGGPLASWWQRVGACLLDGLLTSVVSFALGFPFLVKVFHAMQHEFDKMTDAIDKGRPAPDFTIYGEVWGPLIGFVAITLCVVLAYHALLLRLRGATLGMRAAGIAVRRRDQPGRLPWKTALVRVVTQYVAPGLLRVVPVVGALATIYTLLDDLWPLWDDNRQALHDKLAGTVVVRDR